MDKIGKYITKIFGTGIPIKNRARLREAIDKYGGNYWWESDNLAIAASYQIVESCMLMDFDKFHEGIEKLLGRPVFTHEFSINRQGIIKEARLGLERLSKGVGTSEEYQEAAVARSIRMLEDWCRKNGNKLIKIGQKSQEKPSRDESGIDRSGYDGWLQS
jgi:hypothetical protein